MKKIFLALGFSAALMSMVSCQKDETFVRASISRYQSPEKVVLDADNYACWQSTDQVWVNGTEYGLTSISGDAGHFLIDMGQQSAGVTLNAIYHPTTVTLGTYADNTIGITLPTAQTYQEDANGAQVINAPMVAQATTNRRGGAELSFYNVCSLLKVMLTPNVFVHTITVTSDNAPLAGSGTVSFADHTLTMSGTQQTVVLTVDDARADGIYYIVLPPYTGTNLTVTVYDDPQVIMTLRQNDNGGHTLPANQIASINIGARDRGRGIFSVSDNSKVSFAKGNLTGTSSYDFESEQTASGTSYGTTSRPSISGKMAEDWFYLSQTEWNYLLSRNYGGHTFVIRGSITDENHNTHQGLVLLPDTWYDSLLVLAPAEVQTQFDGQSPNMSGLTVSEWKVCEALGAVFLPSHQKSHNYYYTGTAGYFVEFGNEGSGSNPVVVTNSLTGNATANVRLAHFVVGSPTVAN